MFDSWEQVHDEYLCKSFFGLFIGPNALDKRSKRQIGRSIMKILHGESASSMHESRNIVGALPLSFGVFSFTDYIKETQDASTESTASDFVLNGIMSEKVKQM